MPSFPDRGEVRCADVKNMSPNRTDSHYAIAREEEEKEEGMSVLLDGSEDGVSSGFNDPI